MENALCRCFRLIIYNMYDAKVVTIELCILYELVSNKACFKRLEVDFLKLSFDVIRCRLNGNGREHQTLFYLRAPSGGVTKRGHVHLPARRTVPAVGWCISWTRPLCKT